MYPGEHIDYCLFGVLPAAVERDILIACAPRRAPATTPPGAVVAENLLKKYPRQSFAPSPKRRESVSNIPEEEVHAEEWHLDINTKELRWESYVKAGYFVCDVHSNNEIKLTTTFQGVLNKYFTEAADGPPTYPVPVDLLVTGTVPAGSGLSSSAAMVVASTLAFLAANGKVSTRTANQPRTH